MYRIAHLSVWDVLRLAMLAGSLWQLLVKEKVFGWLQRAVFHRYPPDGYEYPGGYKEVNRVPYKSGRPRLMRWNPSVGVLRQQLDEKGLPLWYRYEDAGDRGSGKYVTDALDPSIAMIYTEWIPELSDPVVETAGCWVVVPGHGSKLGNFLSCPKCPVLWLMIFAFAACWWPDARASLLACGSVATAWQGWQVLTALVPR